MTGGAGFIGSNFVHYWRRLHPEDHIVVLDALTYAGNVASLGDALETPQVTFVRGNIGAPGLAERLLRDHGITTVVHLAAESHVDRSILGPEAFLETNVMGTQVLLKAARQVWLNEGAVAGRVRFLHVSTDEVYGSLGQNDPPFTEESRYNPSSPYAASKAASDHLVRAYSRPNLELVLLLCRSIDQAFEQEPLLARRFPRCPAAERRETAALITHTRDRPGHDRCYAVDGGKIERELGFSPAQSLEAGIRQTVGWYLANEPWWRAAMDGSYRQWMQLNYGRSDA